MSDVVVSAFTPTLGGGRALRTYAIVAALAELGDVHVVYQRFGAADPDPAYRALPNVSLEAVEPSHGLKRSFSAYRAWRSGAPLDIARGVSSELAARAAAYARDGDRVVADGPIPAIALGQAIDPGRSIYSAHNLEIDIDPAMRIIERDLLADFGEVWMPTHRDMDGAAALQPAAALRYAPNVVDVAAIDVSDDAPEADRILFAANFAYEPNREGLRFLVEEVMPALWETRPQTRLVICGNKLTLNPVDPRIEALGFVADIGEQYRRASAVVVPLLSGGGSPLKLIEALAYAKPVVATTHATRLIEHAEPGRDLLAAADGPAMAAALGRVLGGREKRLAAHARTLAEREYSVQALAAHLQD